MKRRRQVLDLILLLPFFLLTVSLRVGSSSSSSSSLLSSSSSSSLSSPADLCGKAGQLVNYTKVEFAHGGFCSASGPSCCHGFDGLVMPGMGVLFDKSTFSQFSALTTLLNDIKVFLKGLECTLSEDVNRQRADVIKALNVLEEIDWTTLVTRTIVSRGGCGLALTKLAFCSPQYCLINESNVIGEGRFCRSDCNAAIRHCIIEPFESISEDWKRAVGTLTTSLRILPLHGDCREKKSTFESFVNKWNDWRDPVSRTNSYCANGQTDCPLSQLGELNNGPLDKSIFTPYSTKLRNVASTLEQYWQTDDALQSSGSGWAESEDPILHNTDDEDLLRSFEDGSGSGQSSYDPIINSNHPSVSTPSSPISPVNTKTTHSGSSFSTLAPPPTTMYITLTLTSLILCFSRKYLHL